MGVLKRGLNGIFSRICTRVLSISMGRVKAWGGTGQAVLPLGGVRSLIYTHKLHANVTTGHLLFSYFLTYIFWYLCPDFVIQSAECHPQGRRLI